MVWVHVIIPSVPRGRPWRDRRLLNSGSDEGLTDIEAAISAKHNVMSMAQWKCGLILNTVSDFACVDCVESGK